MKMFREENAVLYKEVAGKHFYWRMCFDSEQQQITTRWGKFGEQGEITYLRINQEQNYKMIIQDEVTKKKKEGYKELTLSYIFYTTSKVIFTCQQLQYSLPSCSDLKTMFDKVMSNLAVQLENSGFGRLNMNDDSSNLDSITSEYYLTFHEDSFDINHLLLTQLNDCHSKLLDYVTIQILTIDDFVSYYPKE